jgi:hypothetical protein
MVPSTGDFRGPAANALGHPQNFATLRFEAATQLPANVPCVPSRWIWQKRFDKGGFCGDNLGVLAENAGAKPWFVPDGWDGYGIVAGCESSGASVVLQGKNGRWPGKNPASCDPPE